jgi:hypothetical protein
MFQRENAKVEKKPKIDYDDFIEFLEQEVKKNTPSKQDLRELKIQFEFRSYQLETYFIYYLKLYLDSKKRLLSLNFIAGKLLEGLISTKNYFPAYETLFYHPPVGDLIKKVSSIFYDTFPEYRFARQESLYLSFKDKIIEARSEIVDSKREQKSKRSYLDFDSIKDDLEQLSALMVKDDDINKVEHRQLRLPEEYIIASLNFYDKHYPEDIKPFPECDFFCIEFANVFVSMCLSLSKEKKKMSFYNLELAMQEQIQKQFFSPVDYKIEQDIYYSSLFKDTFFYIRTFFSQSEVENDKRHKNSTDQEDAEHKYIPGNEKLNLLISFVSLQSEDAASVTKDALIKYLTNNRNRIYFNTEGVCVIEGLIDENKIRPLFSIIKNLQDFGLELSNTKAAPYIRQLNQLISDSNTIQYIEGAGGKSEEVTLQTSNSEIPTELRRLRISFDRNQDKNQVYFLGRETTQEKDIIKQTEQDLSIRDYQGCDIFELHKALAYLENKEPSEATQELKSELLSLIDYEFDKMSIVATFILQENPQLTDVQILNSLSRSFTNKPLVSNGNISNFGKIILDKIRLSDSYSTLESFTVEDIPGIEFIKQAKKDFEKLEKNGNKAIAKKITEALVCISNVGGWGRFVESVASGDSLGYGWHKGEENFKNCILLDLDRSVRLVLDPAGAVLYIGNYHRHKKKKK